VLFGDTMSLKLGISSSLYQSDWSLWLEVAKENRNEEGKGIGKEKEIARIDEPGYEHVKGRTSKGIERDGGPPSSTDSRANDPSRDRAKEKGSGSDKDRYRDKTDETSRERALDTRNDRDRDESRGREKTGETSLDRARDKFSDRDRDRERGRDRDRESREKDSNRERVSPPPQATKT
jgi:hypothetical protein